MTATTTPTLSLVIIARNEQQAIGRCIESVLRATDALPVEVLLVDSASTDGTCEIASGFPIKVACLSQTALLSPAAGRSLGTQLARGDYLYFVDGDMMVIEGWITRALETLADPLIGGVCGRVFFVPPGCPVSDGEIDDFPLGVVAGPGGGAVYRKSVLQECGGFNPFLRGEEERELTYRLSRKGYRVVRIDVPMVHHLDKERTPEQRIRLGGYFVGVGQLMRKYVFQPIFWNLVWEHKEVFGTWLLGALTALLPVLAVVMASWWPIAMVGIVLFGLGVLAVWKGPRRLVKHLHSRLLLSKSFIRGLRLGLPSPDKYTYDFQWVKE